MYHNIVISKKQKPRYKVLDLVRISKGKILFRKAYEHSWSEEIFRIKQVRELRPLPVYYLEDLKNNQLEGSFHEKDLQLVTSSSNTDE